MCTRIIINFSVCFIQRHKTYTFKCSFLCKAHSTEQTPFMRVLQSGTHLSAESTEAMRIICLAEGHNIMQPNFVESSICISRHRFLTLVTKMLKKSYSCCVILSHEKRATKKITCETDADKILRTRVKIYLTERLFLVTVALFSCLVGRCICPCVSHDLMVHVSLRGSK